MSTEHQNYSLEHQASVNTAYALANDIEIVRTYSDAGISGLTFKRRHGLRSLLADVLEGQADFDLVLVYDVSRWGRFQDPDEAAHHEFLCRSTGVNVCYTAEPFANDGSLAATMVKHIKRAMAAEFSRALSDKVSSTQRGLAAKGYWMGGPPPFGFRRQVSSTHGQPAITLEEGQRAALRGDRVVLIVGPPEEVRTVRRIFEMFAVERLAIREIVGRLNAEGAPRSRGGEWTSARVRGLLRNEVYRGANVLGKMKHVLGRRTRQPSSAWVRKHGCFPALVSEELFQAAQARFRTNKPSVAPDVLLDELRAALQRHGRLSRQIIDADPETHCAFVYQSAFGNLSGAYARIGYTMRPQQAAMSAVAFRDKPHLRRRTYRRDVPDDVVLATLRKVLEIKGRLDRDIIDQAPGIPGGSALCQRFGGLRQLYEILGYTPNERQQFAMRPRGTHGQLDRALVELQRR